MSYQLTVLYHQPDDTAAFDAHYQSVHAPLAQKVPGLRAYTSFHPEPKPDGSPAPEYLVATLVFDDQDAFAAGMGGPEGKAAGDDIGNFASGGVTMLTGEVTSYT